MDVLLKKLLEAYSVYYNIKEEEVTPPFDAEAIFSAKNEQYFLMKSAKLSEMQASEFVYFAKREDLSLEELKKLDETAWERGMEKVEPNPDHKSSDVILIVITDRIRDEIRKNVRNFRHSKSYKLGLWGFSRYMLCVIESSTGDAVYNGQGTNLKKTIRQITAASDR
ncbi:MAG: hypothetical protein K6F53_13050 [Lachnospiraceae bacterium]|nr:hypothetical protein [Lachnospiraceae bacterium]